MYNNPSIILYRTNAAFHWASESRIYQFPGRKFSPLKLVIRNYD